MNARKVPKLKILIVGQVPPPFHGQAMMIEQLVNATYDRLTIVHQPLHFSRSMEQLGRFSLGKLAELFKVICGIVWKKFRYGIEVLYFPPAGPDLVPLIRDLAILLPTRWLFRKTIFHFHAGGVSALVHELSWPLKTLSMAAYSEPDCAIELSLLNPRDGTAFKARRSVIIPCGIPDFSRPRQVPKQTAASDTTTILFVGALIETKGVLVLLEASKLLKDSGRQFHVRLVGEFRSETFREVVERRIRDVGISDLITFTGLKTGEAKWDEYYNADLFCFPSFYESETFGIVLLEAMQFSLPVVATSWRGIPSVIEEGRNGFLVPIKAADALASKLGCLIDNPSLSQEMGSAGRLRYLEQFTVKQYLQRFEAACIDPYTNSGSWPPERLGTLPEAPADEGMKY